MESQNGMERWRRVTLLAIGLLESFVFSGIIFGWASLLFILQEEGVYSHLCINGTDPSNNLLHTSTSHHGQNHNLPLDFENENGSLNDMQSPATATQTYTSYTQDIELVGMNQGETSGLKCSEQANEFTLVYTTAATMYGLTSIFIGFSLDHFGLWATRLSGSLLTAAGFFCLAFTTKESSWLLWPATNLISMGTNQLKLCSYQFTNMWPSRRSTILFAYGSGFSISTTVFTLLQYLYTSGFSYSALTLPLGILSLLTIPTTFFMPIMKVKEYNENKSDKTKQTTTVTRMPSPGPDPDSEQKSQRKTFLNPIPTGNTSFTNYAEKDAEVELLSTNHSLDLKGSNKDCDKETQNRFETPLSTSLLSVSAALHLLWHFVNFFMILFYTVSFNAWVYKSTSDSNQVAFYTEIMGLCQLVGPLFIPITGWFTDTLIKKANKSLDPVEKHALTLRAPTFAKFLATISLISLVVCKMFVTKSSIYISMVVVAISRPLVHSSCTSYLRIRFPEMHFNRLNGIFTTTVAVVMFVQYPIFVWMFSSDENYIAAHWMLVSALLFSLISPCHLMVKKIARTYAIRELGLAKKETQLI